MSDLAPSSDPARTKMAVPTASTNSVGLHRWGHTRSNTLPSNTEAVDGRAHAHLRRAVAPREARLVAAAPLDADGLRSADCARRHPVQVHAPAEPVEGDGRLQ